jgi:thiol-disulfide isomerase/thioredoxin
MDYRKAVISVLVLFAWVISSKAQEKIVLNVGDVAPPLEVSAWIRGASKPLPQPGKVSVIEFWATWCGPCLANIPHLTELQHKYSDSVVVVGATSPDDWGNTEQAVRNLVKVKGSALDYAVAWLPESRSAKYRGIPYNPWFRSAGIEFLPCAFVVGPDGRVAFIGDPLLVEKVVRALVHRDFDFGAARSQYLTFRESAALLSQLEDGISKKEKETALRLAKNILAGPGREDPRTLLAVSGEITQSPWNGDDAFLAVALEAAEKAVSLTSRQAPGMLDALARVWFLKGDPGKAVEIETLAVSLSEGGFRDAQQKNLDSYERAMKEAASKSK